MKIFTLAHRSKLFIYTSFLLGIFFLLMFWLTPSGDGAKRRSDDVPEKVSQPAPIQHQNK